MHHALRNQRITRIPKGPLAVHYCARMAGIPLLTYSTDPIALADSVIRYYHQFTPDAVWISADTWISAEAVGVPLVYSGDLAPPSGRGPALITRQSDLSLVHIPDPLTDGRMPVIIEALVRVKSALGKEVFIVACFDQSPFSLACQLAGTVEMMSWLYTDPDWARELLDFCARVGIRYGTALAEAGADMISTGDSPAGLIGKELYTQFALPAEQMVFTELRNKTKVFLSLHICGDASTLLDEMVKSGADVLELDHLVSLKEALTRVPPQIALWGNLDPVNLLLNGSPDMIRSTMSEIRELVHLDGRFSYILSSGCTLAPDTPASNLFELMKYELNC